MIALYFLAGWLLASSIALLFFALFMGGCDKSADQDRFENHHHNEAGKPHGGRNHA